MSKIKGAGITAAQIAAALSGIGHAVWMARPKSPDETTTSWKKRKRARKAYLNDLSGEDMTDLRADEVWDDMLAAMGSRALPTGLRAARSARVTGYDGGVRLSRELPAAVKQLSAKGILTKQDCDMAALFIADWELAYLSEARMTGRYEAAIGAGGGGVPETKAAVIDARARCDAAKTKMPKACWEVLVQMLTMDVAAVEVSGDVARRYSSAKARRYGVGVLLCAALETLVDIYS